MFRRLGQYGLKAKWTRYDRTKRGWHVLIRINRWLEPKETVALQAILGSDPAREVYNLIRAMTGKMEGGRWNFLFERKL